MVTVTVNVSIIDGTCMCVCVLVSLDFSENVCSNLIITIKDVQALGGNSMGRAGPDTSVMYQRCLADPHLEIGHMQCRVTRLVWLP